MSALKLNNLYFNEGSMKKKCKVERGDRGKSSGRGNKGQKSRSGVSLGDFQGGQTSIMRRLPKQRSFFTKNSIKPKYEALSLKYIDSLIDNGRLSEDIKIQDLSIYVKKNMKIKLIGVSEKQYKIEAHFASQSVIESFGDRLNIIK